MIGDLTIHLPKVEGVSVEGKKILVRADLEWEGEDSPREKATIEIVRYLQQHGAERTKVIGHRGDISMVDKLGVDVNWDLRADPREEANNPSLAKELAEDFDIYINEAFATSHRKHASVDALPRLMKTDGKTVCFGPRFIKELEMLSQVLTHPGKKILVVGGVKVQDKEEYANRLQSKFAAVLRGGLLPGVKLRPDGLDLADDTIKSYTEQIAQANVIVAAGVMGKYEDDSAQKGTQEILNAITNCAAYKVAGGGDLEGAIAKYQLTDKFDWISVGGGAMLEFLANESLPGIEALVG